MKASSIAGRRVNDGIDFYQTPRYAIEKLLEREQFEGNIIDPCSGAGAISKVVEEKGYKCFSSDLREDINVYGDKGANVFDIDTVYDNVITNPPYFCAKEIVEKSLEISKNKVALLLKLTFLESEKRYELFKNTPLRKVYVFCKRITMYNEYEEKERKNNGTIAFAWYICEHGYTGKPEIEWII